MITWGRHGIDLFKDPLLHVRDDGWLVYQSIKKIIANTELVAA